MILGNLEVGADEILDSLEVGADAILDSLEVGAEEILENLENRSVVDDGHRRFPPQFGRRIFANSDKWCKARQRFLTRRGDKGTAAVHPLLTS